MSWNPLNLYNLQARTRLADQSRRTVFQQKWFAKRELRAYHVPNITEIQLIQRHWKAQLPLRLMTEKEKERTPPIQALAFAELERRVDVVVFRSHFASSIWQARMLVVGGNVMVNGERHALQCRYPARRLELGDMVTVKPSVIPTLRPAKAVEEAEGGEGTSGEATPEADGEGEKAGEKAGAEKAGAKTKKKAEGAPDAENTEKEDDAAAEKFVKGVSKSNGTDGAPDADGNKAEDSLGTADIAAADKKAPPKKKVNLEKYNAEHPQALPFTEVPFMSPWMFIPPYLEVSYNTCSAVLIRSPLPQPDHVEVPSPFPPDVHALAFEWYTKKKRAKTKRPNLNEPVVVNGQAVRLKPKFELMMRRRLKAEKDRVKQARFSREAKDKQREAHKGQVEDLKAGLQVDAQAKKKSRTGKTENGNGREGRAKADANLLMQRAFATLLQGLKNTSTARFLLHTSYRPIRTSVFTDPEPRRRLDFATKNDMPVPPELQSAVDALRSMYEGSLGDRLKAIESQVELTVPTNQAFIIRLDGVSFSKFTVGMVKPFDARLKDALVDVTKDLVWKFNPLMGYHSSDEISLVFAAAEPVVGDRYDENGDPEGSEEGKKDTIEDAANAEDGEDAKSKLGPSRRKKQKKAGGPVERTHIYSGRCQKLASITASYASARLNHHLAKRDWSDRDAKVQERMTAGEAFFDGRVVPLPNLSQAMECVFWRSNFDGFRNAISSVAQSLFSSKELHGKNIPSLVELIASKGVDVYKDFHAKYLFGTFVKRELFELEGFTDPRTGSFVKQPVIRGRLRTGSFNWADYTPEERVKFVAAKYWVDGKRLPPKDDLAS
ncbi:hypothetical protein HK101_002246 [Irineochytrium annulatum]|nr:hypothetical protein HK101_002246 [Irineochytrium annulatum]